MVIFYMKITCPPNTFLKTWKTNLTSSVTFEPFKRSPVILLQFNQTQKKIASTQSCLSNSSGFRSIRAFFTELRIIWHCTPLIGCAPPARCVTKPQRGAPILVHNPSVLRSQTPARSADPRTQPQRGA